MLNYFSNFKITPGNYEIAFYFAFNDVIINNKEEVKLLKKLLLVMLSFFTFSVTCYASTDSVVKYYKTVYAEDGLSYRTYEINEIEYNAQDEISLLDTDVVTEYKKLSITDLKSAVRLDLEWKKMPKYRSYDVLALRGEGVRFVSDSLVGIQSYKVNGKASTIGYNRTSSNTKILQNGVGISMNLVDDADFYQLTMKIDYVKTSNNAKIYGAYQHSQADITLAQSQKYSLSSDGYGNVVKFDSSVKSYFDNMAGVSISV